MPVIFRNGSPLFRDGSLAMSMDCCCEQEQNIEGCCLDQYNTEDDGPQTFDIELTWVRWDDAVFTYQGTITFDNSVTGISIGTFPDGYKVFCNDVFTYDVRIYFWNGVNPPTIEWGQIALLSCDPFHAYREWDPPGLGFTVKSIEIVQV